MQPSRSFKLLLTGFIAGCGGGLLSLGGGTLIIPLLMLWGGLAPLAARGLAIATSLFTAVMGAIIYQHGQHLDLGIALWVALPSVLITPWAAAWSKEWPAARLKAVFGGVVMLGGILLLAKDELGLRQLVPATLQIPFLLSVGLLEGLVAGIIGISGGPVLAPLFVLGLGLPQQLAQGCSLAARIPAIVTGTWENWRLGNLEWRLVPPLAVGALFGAWLGSLAALGLPEKQLRSVFAVLLIALGAFYLWQHRQTVNSQKQTRD